MINMCSETSPPRISFSNDLGPEEDDDDDDQPALEHNQSRRDTSLLDSNCDFEFSFTSSSYGHESSSADELFSHGVILPTQPRERVYSPKQRKDNEKNPCLPSLPPLPSPKKDSEKEAMVVSSHIEQKPQSNKSFWGFKRSSSLNYDNKRSLLCSLPLLLRSNSTGSVSNSKRSMFKDFNKHSSKQPSISMARSASVSSSSSSTSSISNPYTVLQKPPLKKNHAGGGSYGNGVRIIPVINVPPPYISKGTAKFFGLSSFLHHGKDKKTKK